jgi:hypothetical protein
MCLTLSKYEFFKEEVAFLKLIIRKNGIPADLNKIKAILEWPIL